MQGIVGEQPFSFFTPHPEQAETEVKFRYGGDVATLQRALNVWPRHRPKQKQLRSVYFDTPDHDLWKNGVTLRLREDGKPPYRMGIKFADGAADSPFRRGEIETEVPDSAPQFDSLAPDLARRLERLRQRKPLVPLFETRITRTLWRVAAGISVVEVVLDEGEIALPDGRSHPLREIEFELKDGRDSDLFDLARLMAGRIEVTLEFQSKSDRGFALLHPECRLPRKSMPLLLKRRQTLGDGIDAILSNTLNHFVGNWTALRETDAPEAIHQLRVALRRMRSAFKMLRHALQSDVFETLREEARHIGGGLGPAREIDSFIAAAEAGALRRPEKPPGCDVLMAAARSLRDEHSQTARAVIDDRRSTLFVLDLQCLLAQRRWRTRLPPAQAARLSKPIRGAARAMLDRLRTRALKRGRGLAQRSDAERHGLRIALKDLRYAMEFFGTLFDHPKRRQRLLTSASELQDILGKHNDAVAVDDLVRRLADGRGSDAAHAAGYLIGWHAHEITVNDTNLKEAWKAFKTLRPFWF